MGSYKEVFYLADLEIGRGSEARRPSGQKRDHTAIAVVKKDEHAMGRMPIPFSDAARVEELVQGRELGVPIVNDVDGEGRFCRGSIEDDKTLGVGGDVVFRKGTDVGAGEGAEVGALEEDDGCAGGEGGAGGDGDRDELISVDIEKLFTIPAPSRADASAWRDLPAMGPCGLADVNLLGAGFAGDVRDIVAAGRGLGGGLVQRPERTRVARGCKGL